MQLRARLVHAEPGLRVVQVGAWQGGHCLGSALGEAGDAEQAEERAQARLLERLTGQSGAPSGSLPEAAAAHPEPPARPTPAARPDSPNGSVPAPAAPQQPSLDLRPQAPAAPPPEPPPADPDDWSDELAALDLQLQRIGWQREQEATYLERAFGHPSRSRLTTYRDLSAYLQAVSQFAPGADPARVPVPLRRSELLGQCDLLLAQLGWDAARGRRFLEEQFQLASRQQLSDEQLLHFNMLLESELLSMPEQQPPPQAVVLPQTPPPRPGTPGPA